LDILIKNDLAQIFSDRLKSKQMLIRHKRLRNKFAEQSDSSEAEQLAAAECRVKISHLGSFATDGKDTVSDTCISPMCPISPIMPEWQNEFTLVTREELKRLNVERLSPNLRTLDDTPPNFHNLDLPTDNRFHPDYEVVSISSASEGDSDDCLTPLGDFSKPCSVLLQRLTLEQLPLNLVLTVSDAELLDMHRTASPVYSMITLCSENEPSDCKPMAVTYTLDSKLAEGMLPESAVADVTLIPDCDNDSLRSSVCTDEDCPCGLNTNEITESEPKTYTQPGKKKHHLKDTPTESIRFSDTGLEAIDSAQNTEVSAQMCNLRVNKRDNPETLSSDQPLESIDRSLDMAEGGVSLHRDETAPCPQKTDSSSKVPPLFGFKSRIKKAVAHIALNTVNRRREKALLEKYKEAPVGFILKGL